MICPIKDKKYNELVEKYGHVDAHHIALNAGVTSPASPIGEFNKLQSLISDISQNLQAYEDSYGKYPSIEEMALAVHNALLNNTKLERRQSQSSYPKTSALEKLSSLYDIDYNIVNDSSDRRKGYYSNVNGRKLVTINLAHATEDTPFHEYFHPAVRILKVYNPILYNNLASEAKGINKIEDEEEALVEYLGKLASTRTRPSFLQRFIEAIKSFFSRKKLSTQDIERLSAYTTLSELASILSTKGVDVSSETTLTSANQLIEQVKNLVDGKFSNSVEEPVKIDQIKALVEASSKLHTQDDSNFYFDENNNKVGSRLTPFVGDRETGVFSVRYKGKSLLSDREIALKRFSQAGIPLDQKITVENGKQVLTLDEYTEYISIQRNEARILGKAQHAYIAHKIESDPTRSRILYEEAASYARQLGADSPESLKELKIISDDYLTLLKLAGITRAEMVTSKDIKEDTFFPELTLQSDILKDQEGNALVTTADGLVLHPNGELTLVDYKTGNITSDIDVNILMDYAGDTGITDTKLNKAYLELAFRAIIIKEKLPNARFRAIKIVKIDSQGNHKAFDLDLAPFLTLVENYYKKNSPEVYSALVEKKLLSEERYTGISPYVIKYSKFLETLPYPQRLEWVNNKLAELTLGKSKEKLDSEDSTSKEQRAALAQLKLELTKQPGTQLNGTYDDIDKYFGKLKNMSDIGEAKFKVFHKSLLDAKNEAKKEFDHYAEEEARLLAAVMEEMGETSQQKSSIKKLIRNSILAVGAATANPFLLGTSIVWGVIDQRLKSSPKDVFSFLWTSTSDGDFLNEGDTYTEIKDGRSQTKTLSKAQREYRDFIKHSMSKVWNETLSRPSHISYKGTKLLSKAEALGMPSSLPSNFMPRIPKSVDEIRKEEAYTAGAFGIQTRLKNWTKRTLTNFIENQYYSEDKGGIPIKYYAHTNSGNVQSANHSYNAHEAYRMFLGNLITKKHLDDMYILAEGLKNIYELSTDEAGRQNLKNLSEFVDDTIYNQILSRPKEVRFKRSPIVLPPNKFFGNDQPLELNQDKILRTIKGGVSFSIMGFKLLGASFNAALITVTNVMGSTKGIWAKLAGIDPEDVQVSRLATVKGFGMYSNYLMNVIKGTPEKSKLWNLAKKFDWMPDNYGYGVAPDDLLYDVKSKGLFSHAYMFHNYVETYGALTHLGVMLNSIKVDTPQGKKRIVDLYDDSGNWIGGTRGKVEVSPGEFKDLEELDALEIKNLKRAYEKLHGSYRKEEKTAIEAYVLGEFLLQFKKFFYTYMKVLYSSPYKDISVGRYVLNKDITRPDNVPVWKWEETVMQGRMSVLLSGILAAPGIDKVLLGLRNPEFYGTPGKRTRLQTQRVTRVVELVNTAMWFMLMLLAYGAAFDDDEENTYAAFRFRRLAEDVSQGLLPKDVFQTIEKPVIAAERVSKLGKAFFDVLSLQENRDGSLKGAKTLISATPIVGNWQQITEMFSKKDDSVLFGLIPIEGTSR